jgi:transcriptional regulator with XRE-family HTH domain
MGRRPQITPAQHRQAARLRARGWTLAAIGGRLGVSITSVHRMLTGAPSTHRAVPCRACGAAVVSAGVRRGDEKDTLCRACAARLPGVTLGQRLKAFRLSAGLSQSALARRAAMSRTKVGQYERDLVRPHLLTRVKLARALGVGLKALERNGRAAE